MSKLGASYITYRAMVGSNQEIAKFNTVIKKAISVVNWFKKFAETWYSVKCKRQSLNKWRDRHRRPMTTCELKKQRQ